MVRPVRQASTFPFVGRAAELRLLRTLLPLADGEGRRVVLLGGEAGSGKSRLVGELAAEATSDGVLVLSGACDAVVRTPYGPFVEALDQLTRTVAPDVLRAALGATGGELTRLIPDLGARADGELAPPAAADPDTERHRLHTAVAHLLTAISADRPLLLVLEDSHWADAPTLLLLSHLARAAPGARLLLLATFRDADADVPRALAELLADLRRSDTVVRMRVAAFSPDEVTTFIRHAAGGQAGAGPPELAEAIGDLTQGNAFLVCELWRALMETSVVEVAGGTVRLTGAAADIGTPESVREVVSQRLARLAPGTAELLELAATAGGAFTLDVLRRAAAVPDAELVARLDEAVRSGMIEELPSRALAYRFAHELVRRALYDRLSGARRAELHLRVGEALEATGPRSGRALADLAHHFARAAPIDDSPRGVDYNVLAARAAVDALAFEEAVERLRTALELRIESPERQAELLIELGVAAHRAGKSGDATDALRTAARIARETGESELLARAAVGYEDACWRPGIADQGAIELLEEAAGALGEGRSELRVRILSGLARALDFRGDHAHAAVVRASAITMARRLKDQAGLAGVLVGAYWSRGNNAPLREILAMLSEAEAIGAELGDTEIRAEAMSWRVPTFVALGDLGAARREVAALEATAEQTAQPFVLHVAAHYGSAIALSDGRLDAAEELAVRSNDWSRLLTGRDASGVHGIQMFGIRREQGRLAELAPVVRLLAGQGGGSGPWRPGLASVLVELGMHDEARAELERVRHEGLDGLRASLWLASLSYLADACTALRDAETAALVYPELLPLAGATVMIGHLVACYGAADRYLGMLAATRGDHDAADLHFARATAHNRAAGMRTWLAHTLFQDGAARLARGDAAGAAPLLAEAGTIAEGAGLRALAGRVRALAPEAGVDADDPAVPDGPAGLPDGLSSREVQVLGLVARGMSNREIGAELLISEHTAANHMRAILRKTGCANRTQAASYAHRHGLVGA